MIRAPQMHVCPAAMKAPNAAPLIAVSRPASSKIRTGDLPPSSVVARANRCAAATPTERPTSVPPVKVTFATPACSASALPALAPLPVTTLMTPSGMPASAAIPASSSVVSGVSSEGFTTTVLPVASAGAKLFARIISGWLNGVSRPQTPIGWRSR